MTSEAVMIVGPPAAGKSTYVRQFAAEGFTILNRDTLGDMTKDATFAKRCGFKFVQASEFFA